MSEAAGLTIATETIKNKPKKHKFNAIASDGYKSQLEVRCAAAMTACGLAFEYEKFTAVLSPAFEYCHKEWVKKELKEKCKGREITLTPDFCAPDMSWIIEAKGMKTPDFDLKWKLFKLYCKEYYPDTKLFIVRNMKDLENTVKILNENNHQRHSSKIEQDVSREGS
jgi:hypothetical protein